MTGSFELLGQRFPYLEMDPKRTSERMVEVPVILTMVRAFPPEMVLEFGNVLRHHDPGLTHDCIDRLEGPIQEDLLEWTPPRRYALVVSISTLEHVGHDGKPWYGEPVDPTRHRRALEVLAQAVAPGGLMALTWPVGYNRRLDQDVQDGLLPFDSLHFMRRIQGNPPVWTEEPVDWRTRYGHPYKRGNGVIFAFRQS